MQINVLSVANNVLPGKKPGTTYNMLDIAFKNLSTGKVEGKKLVSFGGSAAAFEALKDAVVGTSYNVETVKEGDFWVWKNVSISDGTVAPRSEATASQAFNKTPKSTYETPEERARRQVLIVRQSSLSSAIELLTSAKKTDVDEVLKTAQRFSDWVFQRDVEITTKVTDIEDDIPW